MTILQDRLKSLRKENKFSQEEFAKKLNMSTSGYGYYEQGRSFPPIEMLNKIASIYNVSVDYILGNDDIRLKNEVKIDNVVKLPVLGSVRAGVGGLAVEDVIGYEYAFKIPADASDYFYLQVKGDSMEPKISEGDLALVKKQCDVESGELAIVLINGDEGVIKKVVKTENHTVELHSFNPYYPVRTFSGAALQDLTIIGKVINTTKQW